MVRKQANSRGIILVGKGILTFYALGALGAAAPVIVTSAFVGCLYACLGCSAFGAVVQVVDGIQCFYGPDLRTLLEKLEDEEREAKRREKAARERREKAERAARDAAAQERRMRKQ